MRILIPAVAAAVLAAVAVPAAAETKIGVVDPAQLSRAPELKAAETKLAGEFQKKQDEINNEGKRLQDDINRFRRERDTMSPTQRTSTENDLNTRKTNFELKERQYGEEFQRRRVEIQRDVNGRLQRAIAEVAKEKGLDLIVENAAYFDKSLDVTPAIMDKLASYGSAPEPKPAPKKNKK